MASVRQQGARRLGVIIVLVLGGGIATAAVRAGSNDSSKIHTAQAPTTSATEGDTATSAPETTVPTTPETTAGGSSTGATVGTSGSSGLTASGPGAASATSEHPNTGGPLPLLPGLGAIAAGAALRRRR